MVDYPKTTPTIGDSKGIILKKLSKKSNGKYVSQVNDETFDSFFDEITSVPHSPRFQVIIASGILELLINALVERKCKHGKLISDNHRIYTYGTKLVLLNEMNVLTDEYFNYLKTFSRIRNVAAHQPQFKVTKQMVEPFKPLYDEVILGTVADEEILQSVCHDLIAGLWNQDKAIYKPFFNAYLTGKTEIGDFWNDHDEID